MVRSAFRILGLAAVVAAGLAGAAAAADQPWYQLSNDGKVTGAAPNVPDRQWKSTNGTAKASSLASPEAIYGDDDREILKTTTTVPARQVALITFEQDGRTARCTGFFISADTLATAGQCVHGGGKKGEWTDVKSVKVYPGANGYKSLQLIAPYGSCGAKRLLSVVGWVVDKDEEYDYGAIKLDCTLGSKLGWFGAYITTTSQNKKTVATNGYPGDVRLKQVLARGAIVKTKDLYILHKVDTVGGMDGGPLYLNRSGCGRCVLAINSGRAVDDDADGNAAVKISERVFNNYFAWRQ